MGVLKAHALQRSKDERVYISFLLDQSGTIQKGINRLKKERGFVRSERGSPRTVADNDRGAPPNCLFGDPDCQIVGDKDYRYLLFCRALNVVQKESHIVP